MSGKKKSFFISYTGKDEDRAKWVTKILEDAGYTAIIQARDFLVGTHFPENMDQALNNTEAVLTIISDAYLKSGFCRSEWLTAYRQDRNGGRRYIIPVRVEEVAPEGLLNRNIYIDIFGEMGEDERKKKLLEGVRERFDKLESGEESDEERQPEPFWKNETTIKHLPYCRNGYFTGREKTLKDLASHFQKESETHPIQIIAGLGGVGKTEIALEYAYRNLSRYHTVWWVNAEDTAGLDSGYKKLGDAKKILSGNETDPEEIRQIIRGWLENNQGYLIIYDNAENMKTLEPYLPREVPGNVLITSRDIRLGAALEQERIDINIDVLDQEDAAAFLVKRARKAETKGAAELAERLGQLSLALEHAAAYILTNNISFKDYLDLLTQSGLEVFNANEDKNKRYKRTVNSTWRISLDKIKNQAAAQLVYMCSYLSPSGILLAYFGTDYAPSPLKEDMQSALKQNAVIRELLRYSLLSEEGIDKLWPVKAYTMHRLLQETIRESLLDNWDYIDRCVNLFMSIFALQFLDEQEKNIFLTNLPHAVSVADHAGVIFKDDPEKLEAADTLYTLAGKGAYALGYYARAIEYFEKSLKIIRALNPGRAKLALRYQNIATVYSSLGDHEKALGLLQEAIARIENEQGVEVYEKLLVYNALGDTYGHMGDDPQALSWFNRSITLLSTLDAQTLAENLDRSIVFAAYFGAGDTLRRLGQFETAMALYNKSLGLYAREHGETNAELFQDSHIQVALVYEGVAWLYFDTGQYENAGEMFYRTLAIRQKLFGEAHPDTASAYFGIAAAGFNLQKYDEAAQWGEYAFKAREKTLGPNDPKTLKALELFEEARRRLEENQ